MHRSEHWLERTKAESQPKRIIAATVETQIVQHPELRSVEIEVLTKWHVAYTIKTGSSRTLEGEQTGDNSAEFWRCISGFISGRNLVLLFFMDAGRCLTVLDFWESIETGLIDIGGNDVRAAICNNENSMSSLRRGECGVEYSDNVSAGIPLSDMWREAAAENSSVHSMRGDARKGQMGYVVLEDPPTIIQCRIPGRNGTLKILDLRNYGAGNMQDIPGEGTPAQRILDFVQSMIRTLKDNGLGALQNTVSSQALFSFRKKYLDTNILIHTCAEALYAERKALYGGRTECYQIGRIEEDIYHLDFRSFYGGVAESTNVPVRLVGKRKKGSLLLLPSDYGRILHISRVHLRTHSHAYPYRKDGCVIYPTGEFITWLCGEELDYARKHGHIVEELETWEYEGEPALSSWANGMYQARIEAAQKGDVASEQWLKLLGVALYGKFAQTSARWQEDHNAIADHAYSEWYSADVRGRVERRRSINWLCQIEFRNEVTEDKLLHCASRNDRCNLIIGRETRESNPAITAFITSAARSRLYEAMETCGLANLYYVDTDSLFCNRAGYINLLRYYNNMGNGLGQLRMVDVYPWMEIYGYKHYLTPQAYKCSGLPKGTIEHGADGKTYRLRTWLGRALFNGHRPSAQRIKLKYKRNGVYKHGRLGANGRVLPFHFEKDGQSENDFLDNCPFEW